MSGLSQSRTAPVDLSPPALTAGSGRAYVRDAFEASEDPAMSIPSQSSGDCPAQNTEAPPSGGLALIGFWARLLFKAWLTPQRLCGCKPSRRR